MARKRIKANRPDILDEPEVDGGSPASAGSDGVKNAEHNLESRI